MARTPYTDFDLPRQHLGEEGNYRPSRLRDPVEIERIRGLPAGTLLLERQAKGVDIARVILSQVEVGENMAFTTRMLGMAAINTSWYVFGQQAPDVMRRRLKLPKLVDDKTEVRKTAAELHADTLDNLSTAHRMASRIAINHAEGRKSRPEIVNFGRIMGNISLQFAVLQDGTAMMAGNAFEIQEYARNRALEQLEQARFMDTVIDAHPSMAQLADPDSPAGVYWRREAPNGAYEAYMDAVNH